MKCTFLIAVSFYLNRHELFYYLYSIRTPLDLICTGLCHTVFRWFPLPRLNVPGISVLSHSLTLYKRNWQSWQILPNLIFCFLTSNKGGKDVCEKLYTYIFFNIIFYNSYLFIITAVLKCHN